jgi:uncharacterized protein
VAADRPRDRSGRPLPAGDPRTFDPGIDPDAARTAQETLALARELLAADLPFTAHEVFEARWKNGPADERDLWQGLAQWCVAATHDQRGNLTGAERLRQRARHTLARPLVAAAAARYGITLEPEVRLPPNAGSPRSG